jgi:hypothetical protein
MARNNDEHELDPSEEPRPQNKCEVCYGSGLLAADDGSLIICTTCLGWGVVVDSPIIQYCSFGFLSSEWEELWESMKNGMSRPEEPSEWTPDFS